MATEWQGIPKGFASEPSTNPPNKVNSYYVGGAFNESLGQAYRNDEDGRKYNMFAWLLLKSNPLYTETGKDLYVDFAIWGGAYYFNFTGKEKQVVHLDIQFYDFITQSYDTNWTRWGSFQVGDCGKSIPTVGNNYGLNVEDPKNNAAVVSYDYPGNCYSNAYKPAYGQSYEGSQSSYEAYVEACAGKKATCWNDPNSSGAGYSTFAYVRVWPFGVRYISNNGKWNPSNTNLNAYSTGVIKSDHQVSVNWTRNGQDGGKTSGNYIHIKIDENFIKQAHGKTTGVTALKFRWTFDGDTWYYPNRHDGPSEYVQLDNPQLGLLDWGAAGSPQDWPPRFDARAIYRGPGDSKSVEIQGKYNPGNGSWNIF